MTISNSRFPKVAGQVAGHPQTATPASDLTASYTWSKDLAAFLADGTTDGAGTTVSLTTQADTPTAGFTTVTGTAKSLTRRPLVAEPARPGSHRKSNPVDHP